MIRWLIILCFLLFWPIVYWRVRGLCSYIYPFLTSCLQCNDMEVLVLDEADRILDMGFAETLNAIVANLPSTRQTMLFSATQTKSIKDLARLSLKNPMFVSVHEKDKHSTPDKLTQSYIVCQGKRILIIVFLSATKLKILRRTIIQPPVVSSSPLPPLPPLPLPSPLFGVQMKNGITF